MFRCLGRMLHSAFGHPKQSCCLQFLLHRLHRYNNKDQMHLESVRQFVHWLHCRLHPYLPMRSQPEIPPPGIIVKTMHSASAIVNSFFFILNITSLHCFGCLHIFLFKTLSQPYRHFNICGTKGQIACSKIDFSQISSISLLIEYNEHRCASQAFFEKSP